MNYIPRDYDGRIPTGEVKLDCSLGVNGNLLGDQIFERLHEFQQRQVLYTGKGTKVISEGNYKELKFYPRDEELKTALAKWYQKHGVGKGWLTGEHFILGNGSYDILCAMNLLCLTRGRTVMGHAPQFTAYVDHVNCSGSRYDACYLSRESNAVARTLALCAVRGGLETGEMPFSPEAVIADKRRVLRAIERLNQQYDRTLKVAMTYEMSPIMLLYYEAGGGDFNLHRHLMRAGLLTMSCGMYVGLDQTCVRLMLPPTERIDLLLELLEESIQTLPA